MDKRLLIKDNTPHLALRDSLRNSLRNSYNYETRSDLDTNFGFEKENPDGVGTISTVFNMINVYVGLGLLSQAYAFQRGGWIMVFFLGVFAGMCAYTGLLLVACFRSMDHKAYEYEGGATWSNLAHSVMGVKGKWLVFVCTTMDLTLVVPMAMLMMWGTTAVTLPPSIEYHWSVLATTLLLIPSLMLKSLRHLSVLSGFGTLGKFLTILLPIVILAHMDSDWREQNPVIHNFVIWPTLPMGLGVVMLAFSAHACLPSIYSTMREPEYFPCVVKLSFFLMFVFYAIMGGCAYFVFGHLSSPLVTDDATAAVTHIWQLIYMKVVSGLVAWSTYATCVPIIVMLTDFWGVLLWKGGECDHMIVCGVRIALCIIMAIIAYFAKEYLNYLEALIGIMTMFVTLELPLILHYLMFREYMSLRRHCVAWFLMTLCAFTIILIAISSVNDLLHKIFNIDVFG